MANKFSYAGAKSKKVTIRVTPEVYAILCAYAKLMGLSITACLTQLLLERVGEIGGVMERADYRDIMEREVPRK